MDDVPHPLRIWRKKAGITLAELAQRANITPSHLSEIERHKNDPSLSLAAKLSRATSGEVQIVDFVKQGVE